jgi:CBS domain-containing protein
MSNRELAYIIKDQKPLVLASDETARAACRRMWERRSGSVLVVDERQHLRGILTGRDAVRLLAKGEDGSTRLAKVMTRNPVTIGPKSRAIDALRAMSEGDFRHVPVTEDGSIRSVVSRGDLKGMEFKAERECDALRRTLQGAFRRTAGLGEVDPPRNDDASDGSCEIEVGQSHPILFRRRPVGQWTCGQEPKSYGNARVRIVPFRLPTQVFDIPSDWDSVQ